MFNILRFAKFNSLLLSNVLIAFTLSTLPHPIYASSQEIKINLNEAAFALKVKNLIGKINRYREKEDKNKLIDVMLDLKKEIEGYTGNKINIDKQLDRIEQEIRKSGGKLKKDEIKCIRKLIKNREKRTKHKLIHMANCLEYDLPYNSEEESLLFVVNYGHDKILDEETSVPLRVTVGVTVALCGLFLFFVPIPICKSWAPELMKAGIVLAVEGTINRVEDDKKGRRNDTIEV